MFSGSLFAIVPVTECCCRSSIHSRRWINCGSQNNHVHFDMDELIQTLFNDATAACARRKDGDSTWMLLPTTGGERAAEPMPPPIYPRRGGAMTTAIPNRINVNLRHACFPTPVSAPPCCCFLPRRRPEICVQLPPPLHACMYMHELMQT